MRPCGVVVQVHGIPPLYGFGEPGRITSYNVCYTKLLRMLYREGGTQVYVCSQYPNGVTEQEYRRLLREDQSRSKWGWRRMQRVV